MSDLVSEDHILAPHRLAFPQRRAGRAARARRRLRRARRFRAAVREHGSVHGGRAFPALLFHAGRYRLEGPCRQPERSRRRRGAADGVHGGPVPAARCGYGPCGRPVRGHGRAGGPSFRAGLVGGDLSRADKLHLCLTVFGQAEKTLLRGEARPATLFSSSAGRALHAPVCCCLRSGVAPPSTEWPTPCEALCAPPRASRKACACRALRRTGAAGKAIPPAGGLGSWIFPTASPAICPGWSGRAWARTSTCPCRILKSCASCAPATRPNPSPRPSGTPFLGGEDYALIGTCSPELAVHVMVANAETTMLGKVTEGGVIRVDGVPISGGFDHFAG